jgi:hypothetical protein
MQDEEVSQEMREEGGTMIALFRYSTQENYELHFRGLTLEQRRGAMEAVRTRDFHAYTEMMKSVEIQTRLRY